MKDDFRFEQRVARLVRIRELITLAVLRLFKTDFSRQRPLVAIVGDHISDVVRAEGLYERKTLDLLRNWILDSANCRDLVAIDVGANIGNHAIVLSDLFVEVIAFEPNPLARRLLEINLELNGIENVKVRPVGLSDKRQRTFLKFQAANLGAATTVGASSEDGFAVDVELVVGDEELAETAKIGFIKVDVEGTEESVLKGLGRTIRRNQPILLIEQLADAIDATTGMSPCFEFLSEMGYVALDLGGARTWRSRAAAVCALLAGRERHRLRPLERLEKRDYFSLIFLTEDQAQNLATWWRRRAGRLPG